MSAEGSPKLLNMQDMLERQGPADAVPCAEDVFLAWALSLPMDADIATAAQKELIRIDASDRITQPVRRLRELLVEATAFDPKRPFGSPGHC